VRQSFDMLSDAQFAGAVRALLADVASPERIATVGDSDDLFDAGIVDSFGVLQVIEKIEDKFGVSIPNDELIPQNLWSVAAIVGLIKRLGAARS
jgi:acyl carrier protein